MWVCDFQLRVRKHLWKPTKMRRALLRVRRLSGSCWGAETRVSVCIWELLSLKCALCGQKERERNRVSKRFIWDCWPATAKPGAITMATALCGRKVSWEGVERRADTSSAHSLAEAASLTSVLERIILAKNTADIKISHFFLRPYLGERPTNPWMIKYRNSL